MEKKMKARIITDEWKQNISKAQTGKKKPQKNQIYQMN